MLAAQPLLISVYSQRRVTTPNIDLYSSASLLKALKESEGTDLFDTKQSCSTDGIAHSSNGIFPTGAWGLEAEKARKVLAVNEGKINSESYR